MTADHLLVPLHLDALVLTEADLMVGPAAHFSRLPHVWRGADVNPDVPNLGTSVVAPPFQDRSFLMAAGVHLHWALPDGLTRAQHPPPEQAAGQAGGFPAVPNRWLVVRRREAAGAWTIDDAWVVESDFLAGYDHDADDRVSVPTTWTDPDPGGPAPRPFRRMGRRVALKQYPAGLDGGTHLARPLTAMGYGDPTFAAVYQNCHSIFGLHDPCVPSVDTRYDVFGWYADPGQDPLLAAGRSATDDRARALAAETLFGWRVGDAGGIPEGTETICFVSLTIPAKREARPRKGDVELAIGTTATEALSASLARKIGDEADRTSVARRIGDKAGRDRVEEQLEAILLAPRLAGRKLDRAARLGDARHEKGFVATFGGWSWTVRSEAPPDHDLSDAGTQDEEPAVPDAELGARLDHLNDAQRSHDRLLREIEAERGQLFGDWCKYMHVVYPPEATWQDHATFDGDELRLFLEQRADAVDALVRKRLPETSEALEAARRRVAERIDELNAARAQERAKPLALYRIPAPRFYRPAEPVLLIQGDAVRPTDRHGQDGREDADGMLRCQLSSAALLSATRIPDAAALCRQIDRLRDEGPAGDPGADRIGFCTWQQPWHPILLEWEVALWPVLRDADGDYAPDHVTRHYALAADAVELVPIPGTSGEPKKPIVLHGSSILTPHARRRHQEALRAWVIEQCGCSPKQLDEDRVAVQDAYRATLPPGARVEDDLVCTAFRAIDELDGKEFLSQALTGFNDALLALRQGYQLEIADPIGFPCEQALARRVRDLVQSCNRTAPDGGGDFEPIRAGRLAVRRLRLVDTFGQIQDLRLGDAEPCVAGPLRGAGGDVVLPPRFVQPARVNLRWLPRADAAGEAGAVPSSSPVCGWIIVDTLDRSLFVHDAAGIALGVVSGGSRDGPWQAGWQAAPGNDASLRVRDIADPALRRLVEWFVGQSAPQAWEPLLKRILTALDAIDPEAAAHHEDLAVLMGRPLAVFRAALGVALAGAPAVHQGEHAFIRDVQTGRRRTDGFEDVAIPVRLGAHERANDGLVAYWRETPQGLPAEPAWPQLDDVAPILVAPSSHLAPVTLTMLVDPLAEVHARSGILPVKAITIPGGLQAAALKRLEVSFRSLGPVLMRAGRLDVPLPVEPGYAWSWIERDDRGWSAVAGDVGASEDDGAFSGPIVARDGWMRLTKVEPPEPASPDTGSTGANPRS